MLHVTQRVGKPFDQGGGALQDLVLESEIAKEMHAMSDSEAATVLHSCGLLHIVGEPSQEVCVPRAALEKGEPELLVPLYTLQSAAQGDREPRTVRLV